VEQAADAIYLSDPDGRVVDANYLACRWLGYEKSELLSLDAWDVDERFHGRDRYRKIVDALAPGEPVEIETRFLRKDGSTLPVEVRLGGVELKTGRHVLAMVRDITERKKTQAALIAEKAFSEAIIDALPGLFFLYDDQGVLQRWNFSYERQTGYVSEEIIGKRYLDWVVPKIRPAVRATFNEVIESGKAETEVELIHRDGRKVPYRVFTVRLTMDGQPFVVGMAFDISEQKAMETEIKASETRYRIVSDHTHDWEYWLAPEGHLLYCSPSCRRITGYPADDFISMPDLLNRIVHPEDLTAYDAHIQADLANREPGLIEFRILCAEGEVRWIEHVCQPVFEAGQYLGIRAGNRDITDRKLAEAEKTRLEGQLRHAQKMEAIGTLAGGIAHDFNNILGGIIGYAELAVERTPPDDPKLVKYTARILEGGRRAKDLVAQILTVSRQAENGLQRRRPRAHCQGGIEASPVLPADHHRDPAGDRFRRRGDGGPLPDPSGGHEPLHQCGPRHGAGRGRPDRDLVRRPAGAFGGRRSLFPWRRPISGADGPRYRRGHP
jgi:PAS domain S-box-containing protein